MVLLRSTGVVLKVMDHGESDKIVTFYSRNAGRITGIAKGAKRSKKRFVNKLEIFSYLEIFYDNKGKSTLVRVAEAELLAPFIKLRENYEAYVAATLLLELMLCWTQENDPDEALLALLLWALHNLNEGKEPLITVVLFQVRLFSIVGYQPYLTGCVQCNSLHATDAPFVFSPGRSGLLCASCQNGTDSDSDRCLPVSLNTAKLLKNAQELPRGKLSRLRFSQASAQEAVEILKKYGQNILQREVHSWAFLKAQKPVV